MDARSLGLDSHARTMQARIPATVGETQEKAWRAREETINQRSYCLPKLRCRWTSTVELATCRRLHHMTHLALLSAIHQQSLGPLPGFPLLLQF